MPYLFIIFLFGLAVGSFLNCIIYRIEISEGRSRKEALSFLHGRSFCPDCKHQLSWGDLIPLFSFFILRGRCRYCQKNISWQYPIVEISTGLIFLAIYNFQFTIFNEFSIFNFSIVYLLLTASLLIIIFVYDLRHYIIPDGAVFAAVAVSGIWYFVSSIFFHAYTKYEILTTIYSALGASAFFLVIIIISRGRWMGFGDVKLALFMGLFLGFPNILVALFLAFLIGAIIGLGLIFLRRKKMSSEVPFGPFLIVGTFLALFFGEQIISWYINLISI